MSGQTVHIELLGSSFSVQTDESPEYLEALVAQLRDRLEALRQATRVHDPLKLSLLVSITILDELARARKGLPPTEPATEEFSRVAARLIADIDRSLGRS